MSAFYGLGVDNCVVDMTSPEPPVGDGSALIFVNLIQQVGIVTLTTERKILKVVKAHTVRVDDRFITILPYDGLRITFTSINSHPLLGVQFGDYEITPEIF